MRLGPKRRWVVAAAASFACAAAAADAPRATMVVCAPGSPGTTEEAQGAMDAFAAAVAGRAGFPAGALAAIYLPGEDAGVARLRAPDAAVALVSLPFFLKHEKELALKAELQAVPQGGTGEERWALVARKGKVAGPAGLEGFTIATAVGYAPAFVRGPAIGGFGKLPASVKITQTPAVLSALRRAASGEPVAVLLDGAQEAALASLPFAADLEVVARSAALPAGIVARVGDRLAPARWTKLTAALRALPDAPAGAEALAGIRMTRFEPVNAAALSAARAAYAEASR